MLSHASDKFDKAGGVSSIEVVSSQALAPDRRGRERMQLRLQVSTMEGKSSSDIIVLVQDAGQWRIVRCRLGTARARRACERG